MTGDSFSGAVHQVLHTVDQDKLSLRYNQVLFGFC